MKKIIIHSVTIRAEIVEEGKPSESSSWQRTFSPEDRGLPGAISEIFRAAIWYLRYNVVDNLSACKDQSPGGQGVVGDQRTYPAPAGGELASSKDV